MSPLKVCLTLPVVALLLLSNLLPSVASAASTNSTPSNSQASAAGSPPYAATGYFYVTQKASGGWTLVTPQGEPFYASGIDSVATDGSGTDQKTGVCPYCNTVASDFPSTAAWGTSTIAQLRSWGFTSLGPYSDDADLGSQMPYEVQLSMASGDDWFAPSFVTHADQVAQTQVAPLADDPNVIGYFTDSELDWGPFLGSNVTQTALQQYLQLPAGSPGLAVAEQYVGNPSGFLTALATRYFSVTTAAVHMYDTNHLILGVKAEGSEIEPNLIKAAAPYVNVFSIEDYSLLTNFDQAVDAYWPAYLPQQQNLADLEAVANIPLMIGEYSFMSNSSDPNTRPGIYETASSQQQRANQYENFIAPLYEDTPALVGDDWFQYVDEPADGRTGDGENDDFGMIDVNGTPYPQMVTAMQLMHNVVADEVGDNGAICDSWANGSSGVSCTANMPESTTSPLSIVTSSLPNGTVGSSYFFGGVYAAGGTPGYTYALTAGSLPSGLTFDPASGIISGTPRSPGTTSFTVQATDSGGSQPVSQGLSITVQPDAALSVTTTSLPNANQNVSYAATLTGNGGDGPYTWALSSGALPAGLTLNPNGTISGVPTAFGTSSIGVKATDMSIPAETASANVTLDVLEAPPTTNILVPSTGTTVSGSQNLDAVASSGVTNVQYEITGGGLSDDVIATATATVFGWLASWNTTAVPNGTYTLQSVAAYGGGVSGTSPGITITVANSSPTTNILVPSTGTTVSGSQNLDAVASSGVTNVQYEITGGGLSDDVIATATATVFGWLASWNTTAVPNGTYTLQSVAAYGGGVSGTSPGITITVANSSPTTNILVPSTGTTVSGSQNLDAVASSGVTNVQYEITGGGLSDDVIATATATVFGWLASWNTTAVPNGTYTLQSVAAYGGGVSGTSPGITITVANSSPTTNILVPSTGTTVSGSQNLDAVASSGVTNVQYEITGGGLSDDVIATATATVFGWLASWNTTAVPNGTYTLQSVAAYGGGVSGTSPGITITVAN